MAAAQQVHLVGVLELQREEQTDGLQREAAATHVVAQEEVVEAFDVGRAFVRAFWRAWSAASTVLAEHAHEVAVLAVQAAEDLHRGAQLDDHLGLLQHLDDLVAELLDDLLADAEARGRLGQRREPRWGSSCSA